MIDIRTTPKGASPIVIEAVFPATPERLFRAWTDPDEFRKWFGSDPSKTAAVRIDLSIGGAWQVDFVGQSRLEGVYVEISPARRLRFTWAHVTSPEDGEKRTPPSEVLLEFHPAGKSTRMILTHRDISSDGSRINVREGWRKSYIALAASL